MVHRGAPPFTNPTRFQHGFQLVSSCTAPPSMRTTSAMSPLAAAVTSDTIFSFSFFCRATL